MSVDGTWNVTMQTPMGAQAGTLTLATDGGTLTGQMGGPQGTLDLEDGTCDGNSLSWVVNMTSPMPIKIEATATASCETSRTTCMKMNPSIVLRHSGSYPAASNAHAVRHSARAYLAYGRVLRYVTLRYA